MLNTSCCIVGGGPAGMMLGLLLARAGVKVVVLEKHADFLRDFRGDTIHPSTLELMSELGLLDEFLKRPHQEAAEIGVHIGDRKLTVADFTHLPTRCKFLGFMPQWEFLDFLATQAARYPSFRLIMEAEVIELQQGRKGEVTGVIARTPDGDIPITAALTVACDGRHSRVRDLAGLLPDSYGAPMDVLWLRLSKRASDPEHVLFRVLPGRLFIRIDRGDYWQCAFAIPKGSFDDLRQEDIATFHSEIIRLAPYFQDRVAELASWDDVKLLTVEVNRLRKWFEPGLLFIGDAAHAMSPVAGVGINIAIQDAVAAANILYRGLRNGKAATTDLARVQNRRQFPARMTQAVQLLVQRIVISRVLDPNRRISAPMPLRLANAIPWLRRLPALFVGIGIRPEHVKTPERLYR
jgi:2-polyprenyl-6-methoxyphenol hydroxylase-like FAD-dependent oxidoreductase